MKIETTAEELADLATRLRIGTLDATEGELHGQLANEQMIHAQTVRNVETLRTDLAGAHTNIESLTEALATATQYRDMYRTRVQAIERRRDENQRQWVDAHERGDIDADTLREAVGIGQRDPGPYPPPPWLRRWCATHPEPEPPSVRLNLDATGLGEALQEAEDSVRGLAADAPRIVLDDASTIDESGGLDPDHPVNRAVAREEAWAELQRQRATRAAEHAQRMEESARQAEALANPVPVTEDELAERDALEAAATAIDYAERAADHEEELARREQVRAEETARAEAGEPPAPKAERPRRPPMPQAIGDPGANVGDGLDIWRVDGRTVQNHARSAARAGGASFEEARKASGYTDLDYARLALRLEEIRADGRISDTRGALAAILGRGTGTSMAGIIQRAADRGILAGGRSAGSQGRPVPHQLTDYGRRLLHDADAAERGEDVQAPADEEPAPLLLERAAPVAPTPEQQAEIDRLNAENDAHVARTRTTGGAYRGPVATLPLRITPVTNRYLPKDYRRAAGWARGHGWAIGVARSSGHIEWHGPKGERLVTSCTPGTQGTVTRELRELRAAGIQG